MDEQTIDSTAEIAEGSAEVLAVAADSEAHSEVNEFVATGHQIITDGMTTARRTMPGPSAHALEQTLRSLWAHLTSAMQAHDEPAVDAANEQRAAPEQDDVDPPKDPMLKVQG